MTRTLDEYVKIGARFSTRKLIEQAELSERLARASATNLGTRFPVARIDQIKKLSGEIAAALADRAVADGDKVVLTGGQECAFSDGKTWIRNLLDAASSAFDGDEAKLAGYMTSTKIGHSVPRLLERLRNLSDRARADAAALAAEGFDAAEVALGPAIHERLTGADGAQEAAIKALPPKTRDMYGKKGELYLLLKNLERAARRTWRGDPARVASFELALLKRGGTHRGAATPGS